MSYIDKHLLPGEVVTYRTQLHWKLYVGPALLVLLVLLPLVILAMSTTHPLLAILPGLGIVAVLLQAYIRRRTSEFAVTTKRVILKLGVMNTRSVELLLGKVEGGIRGGLGALFPFSLVRRMLGPPEGVL